MISRNEIVTKARSHIGTKWRHQGRSPLGLDCAGLVVVVAHELNISDFDCISYGRRSHGRQFVGIMRDHLVEKPAVNPKPGDIGIFAEPKYPCHTGIFSMRYGVLHIIHAHVSRRKVVEEPYEPHWASKITNLFEYPEVTTWPN